MFRLWNRASTPTTSTRRRDPRKGRPSFGAGPIEGLERRLLMTYTDVAQVAQLTPRHVGATNLYINFDGGTVSNNPVQDPSGSRGSKTINAFETEAGDKALNRDQDIQDILFQVSEVFAPFDVQVRRAYGAGTIGTGNGDSTLFVGRDFANASIKGFNGATFTYTTVGGDVTLGSSVDSSGSGHMINSDAYDVAFVDPVQGTYSSSGGTLNLSGLGTERRGDAPSQAWLFDIKRGIAHEAAHTFGLDHVRSDGYTDAIDVIVPGYLGAGTVNDVQAYDTNGNNQYFSNQSLNLTAANQTANGIVFNGTIPSYVDTTILAPPARQVPAPYVVPLQTQNSYSALGAILGYRLQENQANVVSTKPGERLSVDPYYNYVGSFHTYGGNTESDLSRGGQQYGSLNRPGDYQTFTITPTTGSGMFTQVVIHPILGGLSPELLLYNANGADKNGANAITAATNGPNGTATLSLVNGQTYHLVVGSHDGNSTGTYYLSITAQPTFTYAGVTIVDTSSYVAPPPTPPAPPRPFGSHHPLLYV